MSSNDNFLSNRKSAQQLIALIALSMLFGKKMFVGCVTLPRRTLKQNRNDKIKFPKKLLEAGLHRLQLFKERLTLSSR